MFYKKAISLLWVLFLCVSSCKPRKDGASLKTQKVYGGVETNDFPAVVNLNLIRGGCTATFISRRTLLTAAHCIDSMDPGTYSIENKPHRIVDIIMPQALKSNLSSYGFNNPLEFYAQRDQSGNQRTYGKYPQFGKLDIALMTVDRDFYDTLPLIQVTPEKNSEYIVVGYGLANENRPHSSGIKRRAPVKVDSIDQDVFITKTIKGSSEYGGTLSGDSGGPLLVKVRGNWHIAAVNHGGDYFYRGKMFGNFKQLRKYQGIRDESVEPDWDYRLNYKVNVLSTAIKDIFRGISITGQTVDSGPSDSDTSTTTRLPCRSGKSGRFSIYERGKYNSNAVLQYCISNYDYKSCFYNQTITFNTRIESNNLPSNIRNKLTEDNNLELRNLGRPLLEAGKMICTFNNRSESIKVFWDLNKKQLDKMEYGSLQVDILN